MTGRVFACSIPDEAEAFDVACWLQDTHGVPFDAAIAEAAGHGDPRPPLPAPVDLDALTGRTP